MVFLLKATQYEEELRSSEEGQMHWLKTEQPDTVNIVSDFQNLIDVMLDEKLWEFQYVVPDNRWEIIKK